MIPNQLGEIARSPNASTTNTVCTVWCATALYCSLVSSSFPWTIRHTSGATLFLVVAVVGWALMARKRWGRIAAIGLSGCMALDAVISGINNLTLACNSPFQYSAAYNVFAIVSPTGMILPAIIEALICVALLGYLSIPGIRLEFERSKQATTLRMQYGVATVLVIAGLFSIVRTGFTRNTTIVANIAPAMPISHPVPARGGGLGYHGQLSIHME